MGGKKGSHFTAAERAMIEYGLRIKRPKAAIARDLGRSRSALMAEIRRGSIELMGPRGRKIVAYKADAAQRLAHERSQNSARKKSKPEDDPEPFRVIAILVKANGWSLGAAIAHAERNGMYEGHVGLSTAYAHVNAGTFPGLTHDDMPCPRRRRKKKAERYRRKSPTKVLGAKSIELRGKEHPDADGRESFGHWEGDLVVSGKGSTGCVLTLVERKTRYLVSKQLSDRTAGGVVRALDDVEARVDRALGPRAFETLFRTITWDNGAEFADFRGLSESSLWPGRRCDVYYAHPYCSGERGTNENTNRLLRRAGVPKGCDISALPPGSVRSANDWVNSLPRRALGWCSPRERFAQEVALALPSVQGWPESHAV